MLQTRLWMGSLLVALTGAVLFVDRRFGPWFPCLFAYQMAVALGGAFELTRLLGAARPTQTRVALLGVAGVTAANWLVPTLLPDAEPAARLLGPALAFAAAAWAIFLTEMAAFREPGPAVDRMARTFFVVAYLGWMPSFFAQIRWLGTDVDFGAVGVALAIFVPKGCDIGAYAAGRLFGKHPMTPTLSPKKTWEGAVGGLTFAVLVAIGIDRAFAAAPLRGCIGCEIGFGLSVGLMGMLGDLAESLVKRDVAQKDASAAVPGFGGVLDVVDAIVFAAPAAYAWLWMLRP